MLISVHVEQQCGGRTLTSVLEDALEAFVAAVYHDQHARAESMLGELRALPPTKRRTPYSRAVEVLMQNCTATGIAFAQTERFVVAMIETLVDFSELLAHESNYKDILMKHFQKKFKGAPSYREVSVEGPPHCRTFTIAVHHLDGAQLGVGAGKTKRDAQHAAAREALAQLGLEAQYA